VSKTITITVDERGIPFEVRQTTFEEIGRLAATGVTIRNLENGDAPLLSAPMPKKPSAPPKPQPAPKSRPAKTASREAVVSTPPAPSTPEDVLWAQRVEKVYETVGTDTISATVFARILTAAGLAEPNWAAHPNVLGLAVMRLMEKTGGRIGRFQFTRHQLSSTSAWCYRVAPADGLTIPKGDPKDINLPCVPVRLLDFDTFYPRVADEIAGLPSPQLFSFWFEQFHTHPEAPEDTGWLTSKELALALERIGWKSTSASQIGKTGSLVEAFRRQSKVLPWLHWDPDNGTLRRYRFAPPPPPDDEG